MPVALLMTAEQAELICPACLGSGTRADELKARVGSAERDRLDGQRCRTCGGRGLLGADVRARP